MKVRKSEAPSQPPMATLRNETSIFSEYIPCGYYTVALLDLLGQKEKLKAWESLPLNPASQKEARKRIDESLRPLILLENDFLTYYQAYSRRSTALEAVLAQYPEYSTIYRRFNDHHLSIQHFGDTFVFYAPCMNADGDLSLIPLHNMLLACSLAMLQSLGRGFAVRGAVTVGTGAQLGKNIFYGPALAEVHAIEQTVAQYPRVIVSERAIAYMRAQRFSVQPMIEKLMRGMADLCTKTLFQEADGKWIVDFLRGPAPDLPPNDLEDMRTVITASFLHVRSELDRFTHCGNEKLSNRYERLKTYFQARLPLWFGTQPAE